MADTSSDHRRLSQRDYNQLWEFWQEVEAKLHTNGHKPHWLACPVEELWEGLTNEVAELMHDIDRYLIAGRAGAKPEYREEKLEQAAGEALDVAAYAFFIWDKARQLKEEQEKG